MRQKLKLSVAIVLPSSSFQYSLENAEDGAFAFVSSTEQIGFSCLRAGLSGIKAWWRAAVLLSSDLPS